jgi:TorA maturation chaperone TorD
MNTEMIEASLSRSQLYKFLSRVFIQEIDSEFLSKIRSDGMADVFKEFGINFGKDFYNTAQRDLLDALSMEYAAIFVGGGYISPYESVILEGQLNCKPAIAVEKFYKECGFELPEKFPLNQFQVLPDHIAVELEFMGLLVDKECDAWAEESQEDVHKYVKLEADFLKNHIGKWVPKFCSKAVPYCHQTFYAETLKLTGGFIDSEIQELCSE